MKIFIGSDHAGYRLKGELISFLEELGHEVIDKGAYELDEKDDYPDFIVPVAKAVSEDSESRGIVLGGSGQGEAMTANKIPGVRAMAYYGGLQNVVPLSREHNDANILSIGARFVDCETARNMVKLWLETPFSGDERHVRRIKKIDDAVGHVCTPESKK